MKKKILILGLEMNGYTKSIKSSLEKRNYEVIIFDKFVKINKNELSRIEKLVRILGLEFKIDFFKKKYSEIEKRKYFKYINELNFNCDYVFDLVGQCKESFISILREKYSDSKFILYIWDDLKYKNNILKVKKYYDEVYSYNNEDALALSCKYRSNFYCDEFNYKNEIKEYDFFYVGGLRDQKRIDVILGIDSILFEYKKKFSLIEKKRFKNYFKFKNYKKIKKYIEENSKIISEISEFTKRSKTILDIVYQGQNGLGLRPFESIGANCKLITTNSNIRNYKFYNKNNIFILSNDLSNIGDLKEFFMLPFKDYSDDIKYKYSVDGFIDDIFGVEK